MECKLGEVVEAVNLLVEGEVVGLLTLFVEEEEEVLWRRLGGGEVLLDLIRQLESLLYYLLHHFCLGLASRPISQAGLASS